MGPPVGFSACGLANTNTGDNPLPVSQLESSEARKVAMEAMSSGWPARLGAVCATLTYVGFHLQVWVSAEM
jgi:hypothetical protein